MPHAVPTQSLPLFMLHTVLVPGAALGLRVFEPRYLDLVSDCSRSGGSFGVCLILEGGETGTPATPAAYGTEAVIEDFDRDAAGLLTLQVRGARRFRTRQLQVRGNGLVVGEVSWLQDASPAGPRLQPQHALLGEVLERLLEQIGGGSGGADKQHLEDAAWVGWRLAELLPLEDGLRQGLLQEDDPHARLQQLLDFVSDDL